MNNQTFITYFKVNGKTVTFERWNYKRLATVEKAFFGDLNVTAKVAYRKEVLQ